MFANGHPDGSGETEYLSLELEYEGEYRLGLREGQ